MEVSRTFTPTWFINPLSVTVNICTGLNETTAADFLSVHPNPANDKISILLNGRSDSEILIAVYNVYGSMVKELYSGKLIQYGSNQMHDISVLTEGVYFIKISGGINNTTKFVKYWLTIIYKLFIDFY